MSSTNLEQTLSTYLVNKGSYTATTINFDLRLPSPSGFTYEFETAFNISKDISGIGHVNAICFFMKKSNNNHIALGIIGDTREHFNLNIGTLINHAGTGARTFDTNEQNAYVIVIHNDVFSLEAVDFCFNKLAELIDGVTLHNSPKMGEYFTPRILGVSIIKKN